jgi:RNA polymerase sigma-70 factor, ECF subfamily
MSDNDVVRAVLKGDKEEFRRLIEKYQQSIFRTCIGYVHHVEDANDLTQETFINAYQNLHKFRFESNFSTWLYRISINLSLNFLRRRRLNLFDRLESTIESSLFESNPGYGNDSNPEGAIIEKEERKIVWNEIEKLSDKQKTAFILSRYDNQSQKEIAEIMNLTEGAVESLLQRARGNLQKKLSKYFKKK